MVPKGEPGEGSSLPQRSDHFADFAVNSSAATQVSRESISSRSRFHLPPLITRVKHSRRDPDSSGRSLIKGHAPPATGSLRVAAACGSPRPLLVGKHQTIAGIGTAIQHDTISQCSQNNAKMSISHISHSHSRRYWYCDADRSRASWRPPSGGTGACPRAKPRATGNMYRTRRGQIQ